MKNENMNTYARGVDYIAGTTGKNMNVKPSRHNAVAQAAIAEIADALGPVHNESIVHIFDDQITVDELARYVAYIADNAQKLVAHLAAIAEHLRVTDNDVSFVEVVDAVLDEAEGLAALTVTIEAENTKTQEE